MKKKLLGILMCAALVLTLAPTAHAEEATDYAYLDENGAVQHTGGTAVTRVTATTNRTIWGSDGTTTWYVVEGEVTLFPVIARGDVRLILTEGCKLSIPSTTNNYAGIEVSAGNSLTIYAQSENADAMGALEIGPPEERAAIGTSGLNQSCGKITICGGKITVSALAAAAIGNSPLGSGGDITISGGIVSATSHIPNSTDLGGAGIGSGTSSSGVNSITITGGIVTATGDGAGIGDGTDNFSSTTRITITGGTVTATGGEGSAGIGGGYNESSQAISGTVVITGGSVHATGGGGAYPADDIGNSYGSTGSWTVTDTSSAPVYLTRVQLENVSGQTPITALTADAAGTVSTYMVGDTYTDENGWLYFYLPEGTQVTAVRVGTDVYRGTVTAAADSSAQGVLYLDTAPTVTDVSGTGAAAGGSIAITFSEEMSASAVGTVRIVPPGGQAAALDASSAYWSADGTIYTIPYSGLTVRTAYLVCVSGFEDIWGNEMTADTGYRFVTGGNAGASSASQASLSVPKGGSAELTVTLGNAYGYGLSLTDAAVASVTPTPAEAAPSGSVVLRIEGLEAGQASLVLIFYGDDITETTVPVTVYDETASVPRWPSGGNLAASGITTESITLSWTAAADTAGVTAYRIFQNGAELASTAGNTLTYTVTGLSPTTAYSFRIQAGNANGAWTTDGPTLTVTTGAAASGLAPVIAAGTLPGAEVGAAYNQALSASGDTPITWSVTGGSLPDGLTLSQGGLLSGTPAASGVYSFTVQAENTVGDDTRAFDLTVDEAPVYTITASADSGGSINPSGSVSVASGDSQTFTITANSHYAISSVSVDNVNEGAISTYTFTNVNAAHTISAAFRYTGGSSGNSDSSGSPASSASTPAVSGSTATLTVTASVQNGMASASIPAAQLTSAMEKAREAASANSGTPNVVISLGNTSGVSGAAATIPQASLQALVSGGIGGLTVSSGVASVAFDADALAAISGAAAGDVTVSASQVDTSTLSDALRALVGSRPVYEFTVTSGGNAISQLGGTATLSVPYTLAANEDPNAVIVSGLNADGTLQTVINGHYDASAGAVVFTTTHFSQYAVGYNQVDFTDVSEDAWYADAVTWLAARGISSGTTDTTFSPDAPLTRGQFITLLLKAYDVEAIDNAEDNFSDAGDTYYTGYLAAAKALGISNGVGDNKFSPDEEISRQQMFTLLYNALKLLDGLPEGDSGKALSDFSDSGSVASYAQEAMGYLVEAGFVSGDNGALTPAAATTRAQMAQVLYNLLGK